MPINNLNGSLLVMKDDSIDKLEEWLNPDASKMLKDKEVSKKKELADERHELGLLLSSLPSKPPQAGSREYEAFLRIQAKIQLLKEKVSKKHDELMEILKTEEKISREIQGGKNYPPHKWFSFKFYRINPVFNKKLFYLLLY